MSLSRSVPEPSRNPTNQLPLMSQERQGRISYVDLVRFLVEPFLESPESLRVDCERSPSKPKVWIRMAFDDPDKGRVFGRGGRNIQAVRIVLEAAAQEVGESIYLDIYGEQQGDRPPPNRSSESKSPRAIPRRPSPTRPSSRLRSD